MATTDYLKKYADGGSAPSMPPMPGAGGVSGGMGGGMPPMPGGDAMGGGAPPMDPMAGGAGAAPAGAPAPTDPAMSGAGSPEESINQLEQLAGQYGTAPSAELKDAIVNTVMQLFGGGQAAPASQGTPAGGQGGAPAPAGPPMPMPGGGGGAPGAPASAGPPAFKRGGVAPKVEKAPLKEMPDLKKPVTRKASF